MPWNVRRPLIVKRDTSAEDAQQRRTFGTMARTASRLGDALRKRKDAAERQAASRNVVASTMLRPRRTGWQQGAAVATEQAGRDAQTQRATAQAFAPPDVLQNQAAAFRGETPGAAQAVAFGKAVQTATPNERQMLGAFAGKPQDIRRESIAFAKDFPDGFQGARGHWTQQDVAAAYATLRAEGQDPGEIRNAITRMQSGDTGERGSFLATTPLIQPAQQAQIEGAIRHVPVVGDKIARPIAETLAGASSPLALATLPVFGPGMAAKGIAGSVIGGTAAETAGAPTGVRYGAEAVGGLYGGPGRQADRLGAQEAGAVTRDIPAIPGTEVVPPHIGADVQTADMAAPAVPGAQTPARAAGERLRFDMAPGGGTAVSTEPPLGPPAESSIRPYEPVTPEAVAQETQHQARPATVGGAAANFSGPLRPFDQVVADVDTRGPIAKAIAGRTGINPSLLDDSDTGKGLIAYYRQRGSADALTNVAVQSSYDAHAGLVGTHLNIDGQGMLKLSNGQSVPWNDAFSNERNWSLMSPEQQAVVADYRRVVEETEFLRVQAGLKPRATSGPAATEGWYYIPRQVEGVRGIELRKPSNASLARHYEDAAEGMAQGVKYESDPRAVLTLHLRRAYQEIVDKQFSDYIEQFSAKPSELVPENIRNAMTAAIKQRQAAERALRNATNAAAGEELTTRVGSKLSGALPEDVGSQLSAAQQTLRRNRAGVRTKYGKAADAARANLDTVLANYNTVKARYSNAVKSARAAEYAPGSIFGQAPAEIPIASWRGRFLPRAEADKLNEALGAFMKPKQEANPLAKGFQVVGDQVRFFSSIADFGAGLIQGLPLLGRNPAAWAKVEARSFQAFLDPAVQARYIRANSDVFQEMAAHNIPVGDVEFFKAMREGEGLSPGKLIAPIPGGKAVRTAAQTAGQQSLGRFAASYDTFLTMARGELWKGMRDHWGGSLDDLAAHVKNMTGGLDSKAIGVGPSQRGFESTWLGFSPRLMRSTGALMGDLTGVGGIDRAFAAWRSLGGLAAGATAVYVAAGLGLNKPWSEIEDGLNPLNGKRFMAYQVNGDWYGVGGQVRAMLQLLARTGAPLEEAVRTQDAGKLADYKAFIGANQFDNPLLSFFSSRAAPATRIALATGEAATHGKVDLVPFKNIDSLPDLLSFTGTSALPFAVQGIMEARSAGRSPTSIATQAAVNLTGARTSPQTPWEGLQAAQNAEAQRQFHQDYDALSKPDQATVNASPTVAEPQQRLDTQQTRAPTATDKYFDETTTIRDEFKAKQEADDKLLDEFWATGGSNGLDPSIWQSREADRARSSFDQREGVKRALHVEFADSASTNAVDKAIDAYFAVDLEKHTNASTGEIDWPGFFSARDKALGGLSDADRAKVTDYIHRNETTIQQDFRKLQQEADPYYNIVIPKDADGAKAARAERATFRKEHPRIDAILYVTGGPTKLSTPEAQTEALRILRGIFGANVELPADAIPKATSSGGGRYGSPGGGSTGGGRYGSP